LDRKAREIYLQLVKEGEMIYVDSMEELSQVSRKIFDITVNEIKKIRENVGALKFNLDV
jgi:thymidylate kinase